MNVVSWAAGDPVHKLQAMCGQLIAGGLPLLARPGGQEFELVIC